MPANNNSRDPSQWSVNKLIDEADKGNAEAIAFLESDACRQNTERILEAVKRNRKTFDRMVDKVVSDYTDRAGDYRQRGLAEFCARLAREFNLKPLEVLDQTTTMLAGMVDAMQTESVLKCEQAYMDQEHETATSVGEPGESEVPASDYIPTKGEARLIDLLQTSGAMSLTGIVSELQCSERSVQRWAETPIELGYITKNAGRYATTKKSAKLSL